MFVLLMHERKVINIYDNVVSLSQNTKVVTCFLSFYPDIYAASWFVRLNDYHHSHTHTARNISFKGSRYLHSLFYFLVKFNQQAKIFFCKCKYFKFGFREFISFLQFMCCPANYWGSCYNFWQVLNDALYSKYTSAQVFYNGNQCNDHNLCDGDLWSSPCTALSQGCG